MSKFINSYSNHQKKHIFSDEFRGNRSKLINPLNIKAKFGNSSLCFFQVTIGSNNYFYICNMGSKPISSIGIDILHLVQLQGNEKSAGNGLASFMREPCFCFCCI